MTEQQNLAFVLALPESATMRAASAIRAQLLSAIEANNDVAVDLDGCTEVDIGGVQLIAAARAHAECAGKRLALLNPAHGPLLELLQLAGILDGADASDRQFWLHVGAAQ